MSGKTKRELIEEIDFLKERLMESRDKEAPPPKRVPEAEALAACIRALDALEEENSRARPYSFSSPGRGEATGRVLRMLASRFGIELFTVDVRHEPCSDAHVHEASTADLVRALVECGDANQTLEVF